MRILLGILDAGGGHRSAARAVAAALAERAPEVEVEIEDVGRGAPVPFVGDAPHAYRLLLNSPLRPFFEVAWRSLDRRPTAAGLLEAAYPLLRPHALAVWERLPFDLVVGMHAGVAQVFNRLRQEHGLDYRVATVVTDLVTIHALWADPAAELCLVPTEEAARSVRRRRVPGERVQVSGFPIHPDFARLAAPPRRDFPPGDPPRILLMGGGTGSGGLDAMLDGLLDSERPIAIDVVTGHNAALRERLARVELRHAARVHGFVTEMAQLMAACDVVVTKAGPGSLMEAWALRKPTLVGPAHGPQERGNREWGERRGLAWPAGRPAQLRHRLTRLLDRWDQVLDAMQPVPADGAYQIADALLALLRSA